MEVREEVEVVSRGRNVKVVLDSDQLQAVRTSGVTWTACTAPTRAHVRGSVCVCVCVCTCMCVCM